jgi:hypothetical protein
MRVLMLLTGLAMALFPVPVRAAESVSVCTFIEEGMRESGKAVRQFDGRFERSALFLNYLVRYGDFDVDGDGIADSVREGLMGTAGGDTYDLRLSSADFRLNDYTSYESASGFDDLNSASGDQLRPAWLYGRGWLPYRGRMFSLYFAEEGATLLRVVTYFEGPVEKIACVFDNMLTRSRIRSVHAPFRASGAPRRVQYRRSQDLTHKAGAAEATGGRPACTLVALKLQNDGQAKPARQRRHQVGFLS